MRRLARWLFNAATVVSVLLFIATCVLWVRGCFAYDSFSYTFQWHGTYRRSVVVWSNGWIAGGVVQQIWVAHGFSRLSGSHRYSRGFTLWPKVDRYKGTRSGFGVAIPCWMIMVASTFAPALGWRRWRKHRRAMAEGHCRKCGYDLRASKDRCPECGAPIEHVSTGTVNV